jgi:hypothetical protein
VDQLIEARVELSKVLTGLSRTGDDAEIFDLLADIVRDGEVGFSWQKVDGEPIRVWYSQAGNRYADRIFPLEHDSNANIAERFLEGEYVFTVLLSVPPGLHWHRNFLRRRDRASRKLWLGCAIRP